MEFTILGKVVAKGRPRFTRQGHTYTPKRTRDYEKLVKLTAMKHFKRPLTTPLRVEITVCKTPPKSWSKKKKVDAIAGVIKPTVRPDVDNYVKSILDGCDGVVFEDDKQIVELLASKVYSEEDKAIFKIKEL